MDTGYAGSGPAAIRRANTFEQYAEYFESGEASTSEKLSNFTKYVPREALARFLVKYEMFKRVLDIQGSVIECGVFGGAGLMAFAQISEMLEPLNHQRKIIGFDTFEGFPHVSEKDGEEAEVGAFSAPLDDVVEAAKLWDSTRYLNHIPKIVLVRGDACDTIPGFIHQNPHTIVSLLYLDIDLYEPTKAALQHFVPRMPRGAVIAFDELNDQYWPGETVALLEVNGVRNLRIERGFATSISFAVLD